MLIFALISDNPPRLAMLTAGCQCLIFFFFYNQNKMLLLPNYTYNSKRIVFVANEHYS